MKVMLLVPTMDRGGAEKQVVLLAQGLHTRGHDVRVCLLTRDGPRSETLRAAGIPVEVIGKRWKGDPTALVRLSRSIRNWQPDVVHTWLFAANSFGRVAARRAGVPVVIASERCVDPWKRGWNFWVDRRLQKITDAITTNSHGVVEFYSRHGIDASQFVVIPNGILPPVEATPGLSRKEALTRLGVAEDRKLIVAVGRLWPQKRVRDMIWAGELLGSLRGDTSLVIVGDGPQRGELMRHRDAVSRPETVCFVGWRDDLAEWLPHADVFWIASQYEGQSNAVIEAMQAGVPVIASDIPGNRDLITDGQTGWLFPLGDEAELARRTNAIWQDPPLIKNVTAAAKEKIATEFSVGAMVQRHEELYQRLLSGVSKKGRTSAARKNDPQTTVSPSGGNSSEAARTA